MGGEVKRCRQQSVFKPWGGDVASGEFWLGREGGRCVGWGKSGIGFGRGLEWIRLCMEKRFEAEAARK